MTTEYVKARINRLTNMMEVQVLEPGEVIQEGDLYLSTNGDWQPTPIVGSEVLDNGVRWGRPVKKP